MLFTIQFLISLSSVSSQLNRKGKFKYSSGLIKAFALTASEFVRVFLTINKFETYLYSI